MSRSLRSYLSATLVKYVEWIEALRYKWLKSINNDPLFKFLDLRTLFCKACERSVEVHQKLQINQHVDSTKLKSNLRLKAKRTLESSHHKGRSRNLTSSTKNWDLSANISWYMMYKLESPTLRAFLNGEVYCHHSRREHSQEKNYWDVCFRDVILRDDPNHVRSQRPNAVRSQRPDAQCSSQTSMSPVWPTVFTGCAYVREMFPRVNFLIIACIKKVFLKIPTRLMAWKDARESQYSALPWNLSWPARGTWIQAALYTTPWTSTN